MDVELAGGAITYQPNDDQLGGVSLQLAAFDGEAGIGSMPTPDPAAGIDVYDGRSCVVREIATLVVSGFIQDQERIRGPQPAGTARMHTFSVMDPNALLDGFRIARSRSSETDVARVLAFAAADFPSWVTTWVLNTETVTLPAKKFDADGGWMSELIPDLVEWTGKTLFVHDLAYGGRCLHYHNLTSGHGCGLTVSDVPSAVDGVTVFAPGNPRRERTSVDLRNDIQGKDQAGRTSSATDATSIARHDADGLHHQSNQQFDTTSQTDLDVKTSAFLASNKDERDTYTCDLGPLDATALARIRVGDIITVTSSVMGLTASPQRISHMTLSVWTGSGGPPAPGLWMASLEMGAPVRRRRRSVPKPFVDEPWVCVPTDFTVPWVVTGGKGSCVIPGPSGQECYSDDAAAGGLGGNRATLYDGATYRVDYTVYHSTNSNDAVGSLVPMTGPATAIALHSFGGSCPSGSTSGVSQVFASETFTPSTGAALGYREFRVELHTTPYVPCGYPIGVSIEAGITWLHGTDPRFSGLPECMGEPRIGQRVRYTNPVGDGTTTAFTTTWPYQPGSLKVFVNGLDWTAEVNEGGPTTGAYSLDYPVPTGATVIVEYRRAS